MSSSIISVENLSKSYMVGHEGPRERYHSLRDTIVRNARSFARTTRDMIKGKQIIQVDSVEEFMRPTRTFPLSVSSPALFQLLAFASLPPDL